MRSITFVSTFPNEANMRDGYFRRVHYVDQVFGDNLKIHLDIRFATNFFRKTIQRDETTKIMHLNAFFHFFLIWSVLRKSGIVYIHSIAKAPSILIQMMILNKRIPFALDLHGVMVDELKLEGKRIKAGLYLKIENLCFKITRLNVFVSKAMQRHFREKYPDSKANEVIFAPANNQQSRQIRTSASLQPATKSIKKQLGYTDEDIIVMYSGNMQKWQNIDLMLEVMESLTAPNIKFLILSGQKKQFEIKIRSRNIPDERISVLSVSPDDLGAYYELAHYGFILRDDILVNRVANPTKLAEYLQYGITPIVKLMEIGDYKDLGYNFVEINGHQISSPVSLMPEKSTINPNVFNKMCKTYGGKTLRQTISETIGNTNKGL